MNKNVTLGDVICLMCISNCIDECCKKNIQNDRRMKRGISEPKNYSPYDPNSPKNQNMDISNMGSDVENQLIENHVGIQ